MPKFCSLNKICLYILYRIPLVFRRVICYIIATKDEGPLHIGKIRGTGTCGSCWGCASGNDGQKHASLLRAGKRTQIRCRLRVPRTTQQQKICRKRGNQDVRYQEHGEVALDCVKNRTCHSQGLLLFLWGKLRSDRLRRIPDPLRSDFVPFS